MKKTISCLLVVMTASLAFAMTVEGSLRLGVVNRVTLSETEPDVPYVCTTSSAKTIGLGAVTDIFLNDDTFQVGVSTEIIVGHTNEYTVTVSTSAYGSTTNTVHESRDMLCVSIIPAVRLNFEHVSIKAGFGLSNFGPAIDLELGVLLGNWRITGAVSHGGSGDNGCGIVGFGVGYKLN